MNTNPKPSWQLQDLLRSAAFPHAVTDLQLLETHISWVILTGPFAYKIKKPVRFDFIDYSTLERRRAFCDLELQFNRRFAPEIYLDVVPIFLVDGLPQFLPTDTDHSSSSGNDSDPIEYAVKMQQFSQSEILAARLQHPELTPATIDMFGQSLADLHAGQPAADVSLSFVQPDSIAHEAVENFVILNQAFAETPDAERIRRLESWTHLESERLLPKFRRRLEQGKVKQCHGDLHLKNIVQLQGTLIAFDGIEFNEAFQWIDVLSELAFPVMDFMARGRSDLGWRLLNAYIERANEFADLDVLRFYIIYRALVRAKVTWLNPAHHPTRPSSSSTPALDRPSLANGPWAKYIETADFFAFHLTPQLAITHGFSGSGKSTVAMQRIMQEGGIRIRADVQRPIVASEHETSDKYTPEMSDLVYERLRDLATAALAARFPVIVDATFLQARRRQAFASLAREWQVPFDIIECDATYEELCQRIQSRHHDPSEATTEVLDQQMKTCDPLTEFERACIRRS